MLEILRDSESVPIPTLDTQKQEFDLFSASETDLKTFLLSCTLNDFSDIDPELQGLDLKIYTQDTLDYFIELYPQHKQFSKDSTEALVIFTDKTYIILSLNPILKSLTLLAVTQKLIQNDYTPAVTHIVNTLLHWLWLRLNSF